LFHRATHEKSVSEARGVTSEAIKNVGESDTRGGDSSHVKLNCVLQERVTSISMENKI